MRSASLTCSLPTMPSAPFLVRFFLLCSSPIPWFRLLWSPKVVFGAIIPLSLVIHEGLWLSKVWMLYGACIKVGSLVYFRYRFQDQNRWIARKKDQTTDMVSGSVWGVACLRIMPLCVVGCKLLCHPVLIRLLSLALTKGRKLLFYHNGLIPISLQSNSTVANVCNVVTAEAFKLRQFFITHTVGRLDSHFLQKHTTSHMLPLWLYVT
jgi:hypothetical protein